MREILFRGKRTDTGEWVYGYYEAGYTYENKIPFHRIVALDRKTLTNELAFVHPETVGQYTGLTDRNGKRIFEGDIVKSCEYDDIYFVKYCADNNYPAFDVVPEMNVECNGLSHLYFAEGIEVIGNIHDNPDLLT